MGQLPPVTDDCQTIQNSIQILNAQLATTFSVESGHQETLSFGTCTIFFENLGRFELDYCWSDLVRGLKPLKHRNDRIMLK